MSTAPAPSTDGTRSTKDGNGVSWLWLFVAASVLTIVFFIFAVMTYLRADDPEMTDLIWARLALILQGIEAIAFTAVGWLFGREVHRGEAKAAKDQVVDVKKTADDAKLEAKDARTESVTARRDLIGAIERAAAAEQSGWRLAEAVRARTGSGGNRPSSTVGAGANQRSTATTASPGDAMVQLKDLADSLFPPPQAQT